MVLRPCLGLPGEPCGEATPNRRCPKCAREWEAARPWSRRRGGYDAKHDRLRKVAIARQPWCSLCKTPDTPSNPLELDHRLAKRNGGKNVMSNAQVLCRFHNRQKGARTEA